MSVQWCDFSEFQRVIGDTYPHPVAAFRSNDGTYRDQHFAQNHAWARAACDSGKLAFFIVYAVYEPDGGNWVSTLMSMVGTPHPRMVVMMDIESWGGRIAGDHSSDINAGRARIAQWLGDSRRVIGYGNMGDLRNLWPNRGDARVVVAAYGFTPSFPNMIAHQYTSSGSCPPFGAPVDMNSADGLDIPTLMSKLGLTATYKEDVMYTISAPNSGVAVVGAGYFHSCTPGEAAAAPLLTGPIIAVTDTQFGLIRTLSSAGDAHYLPQVTVPSVTQALASISSGIAALQAAPDVNLTDAQIQTIEAGVVAALTGTTPPTPDEIAVAVRAKFATDPLTSVPFEIK